MYCDMGGAASSFCVTSLLRLLSFMMQEVTWLKQFLSKIINTNSAAGPVSRSLVIPLTVTTRWTSIDLTWTASDLAQAVCLPMHLMSEQDTLEVRFSHVWVAARCKKLLPKGLATVSASLPEFKFIGHRAETTVPDLPFFAGGAEHGAAGGEGRRR